MLLGRARVEERVSRALERIRGVASVDLYGVDPLEVRVDLNLPALKQHGIDAGELMRRIDAANFDMDLGAVRGDSLRYDVRHIPSLVVLEVAPDGRDARVVSRDGRTDVATGRVPWLSASK